MLLYSTFLLKDADNKFNKWSEEFVYTTKEFFLDHAKSIGKPAVDYYNKMFNEQG